MLKIAIVGRPNVGKSRLFNRLTGTRHALVHDKPGVTRDWREGTAYLGDQCFTIIDTAGLEEPDEDSLEGRMFGMMEAAMDEADGVLFLLDGRAGVLPHDEMLADSLRRLKKPVRVVINKCEKHADFLQAAAEVWGLGVGAPVGVSAEHGLGMGELYGVVQEIAEATKQALVKDDESRDSDTIAVAIVGRPNAGKSTLVNTLLGQERVLTGPESGITRDSIAVKWHYKGREIKLVDTAGMRRHGQRKGVLEHIAVADAKRAVDRAHIAVVLMDATEPFSKQDASIINQVIDEGRGLVVGLNKWDLVVEKKKWLATMEEELQGILPQVRGVPMVALSALKNERTDALMDAVLHMYEIWNKRISTSKLNDFLIGMTEQHPPPLVENRRLKLRYMTQVNHRPPSFVLFVSRPDSLPEAYKRYLVNGLRTTFNMPGVPIRLMLRGNKNPYAKD